MSSVIIYYFTIFSVQISHTQTLSGAYPAGGHYGVIHERTKTTGTGLRRPLPGRENQNRKSAVLTEFVSATGFNRKYAVGIPVGEGKTKLLRLNGNLDKARITRRTRKKRACKKRRDPEAAACIAKLREFFNGACGRRQAPLIRADITAPVREPRFGIAQDIRRKPVQTSRSTVERILKGERKKHRLKGTAAANPGSLLRNRAPVKVFWPWDGRKPGFCETDAVSRDGGGASGECCFTLTVAGTATGRTGGRGLKNKARRWIGRAVDDVYAPFPVPLKGGGGGEFINNAMKAWRERRNITFTRTRSCHKNDACYVEQKNGDAVRKTVGYARYANGEALAAARRPLNPPLNRFHPAPSPLIKHGASAGRRGRSMASPPRRMNGFWRGMMCLRK